MVPTPRVQSNTGIETTNTLVYTYKKYTYKQIHIQLMYEAIEVLTFRVQSNTSIETTNTLVYTYEKYTCIHIHTNKHTVNV